MKFKIFFILFAFPLVLSAQVGNLGSIHGKVYDAISGAPILGANVTLLSNNLTIQTNTDGQFIFKNIPQGKIRVKCVSDGYEDGIQNIEITSGIISNLNFRLTPKSADDKKTFFIGGIEVTANAPLKNQSLSTTTILNSGEIEHLQASDLGDVLQLLPGIETLNPSMDNSKQAVIRQISKTNVVTPETRNIASLGTQIIIDDVPSSNNANMQGELGKIISTSGAGIDLRSVPADNVESVEVIRGVPSARYGDLAGGAIKVTTSKKQQPNRLKFKYNPSTQEANFSGGMAALDAIWSYNLNVARSVRDVRLDGDAYTRINAQMGILQNITKKWNIQHKLLYSRTIDEFPETDDPYLNRKSFYNRDYSLQYSFNSNMRISEVDNLDVIASFQYTNQDSYYQETITRDNSIFSTRLTPGTQQGIFVGGSYFSQYWTKGTPILGYFNTEYKTIVEFSNFQNHIFAGLNLKYEKNLGEGRIFNPLNPPSASQNIGDRPRKYDDIPGEFLTSLFLVDKIKGKFLLPFHLEAGLRYELYDPKGPFDAYHGTYLNPRINLQIFLSDNKSLRFGYGISSKAPTLSQLYPNPRYFDVIDTNSFDNDPAKRFSLVTTYIVNVANPNLKGFTQRSIEAGGDFTFGQWQTSISAYNNKTDDGLNSFASPYYLTRYSYPNWPSTAGAFPKDTGVSSLRSAVNNRYIENRGIEFTLISPTIYFLNGRLQIDAAYTETRSGQTGGIDYWIDITRPREYFYKTKIDWGDQLLISYRLTAASQVLGLWATVTVQQMVFERDQDENLDDSKYPLGYRDKTGKIVWLTEEEKRSPEHAKYVNNYEAYRYLTENRPNKFLVNLRVSKSLFSGAEISFFVNNLLNDHPLYSVVRTAQPGSSFERRNIDLFYGIEFSSIVDKIFK